MTREASVATLRRLAEADDALSKAINGDAPNVMPLIEEQHRALAAYRSEIAPLRTRAEVDAEIVTTVRSWFANSGGQPVGMADATVRALVLSCREPTRDSGPSSADAEEAPSPRPPASPAGAAISPFDEACRSLGYCLYRTCSRSFVANTFAGLQFYDAAVAAFDLCAIHDPDESSGPPGAVAAKESRDNAAAPEGAAKAESHACNPGERDCNCDQALHLEKRIGDAVRAIRRSNTIPAGLLHELLGILEGEA